MHLTDLTAARAAILGRHTSAQACLETSLEAANSAAARCAFISLSPEVAREQARFVDAALARGTDPGRAAVLASLAVSVKDLYDVAGERTLAASRVLDDRAPAAACASKRRM